MSKLARLAINEEGFIFDPATGNSFTTNRVGLWIIQQLKEGKTTEQILQSLVDKFVVDPEVAQRDLMDFLAQLRVYRLI
ncbi:PqqD family protein [Thermosulfuriphilus sp.]